MSMQWQVLSAAALHADRLTSRTRAPTASTHFHTIRITPLSSACSAHSINSLYCTLSASFHFPPPRLQLQPN